MMGLGEVREVKDELSFNAWRLKLCLKVYFITCTSVLFGAMNPVSTCVCVHLLHCY